MPDLGPSLAKLRRDWSADGSVELPTGMIARRVVCSLMRGLAPGDTMTIERLSARRLRVTKGAL